MSLGRHGFLPHRRVPGHDLFAALGYQQIVPKPITALLTVVVFVAVTIGLGRLGLDTGQALLPGISSDLRKVAATKSRMTGG